MKVAKQNPFSGVESSRMIPVVNRLRTLPSLVQFGEVDHLRKLLKQVAKRKLFILQGGDCAEQFSDCNPTLIEVKIKIILQMSLVISWIGKIPTLRIGRMAGQYAKPRSVLYTARNRIQIFV